MERVRLVGIARGAAQVLVQRTVVADAQGAFGRIDVLDPFDLELDDGRVLRVEPTKEARIEPRREEKVEWGTIEDDPSFASLREKGPGPHVTVVVKRSAVRAGDRVALVGDEKDFSFEGEDASGMRSAPTKKLSVVTADVLAAGHDAEKILAHVVDGPPAESKKGDRKKKKKKKKKEARELTSRVTLPTRFVAAAIVLLLAAATMRASPGFVDFVASGITVIGVAVLAATWQSLPRFVRGKKVVEDESGAAMGTAVVGGMLVASMLFVSFFSDLRYAWAPPLSRDIEEPNASWLVGSSCVVYLVAVGVTLARSSRGRGALLETLLAAPPFTDMPTAAKWGSVEGVVRDPTPVAVGSELAAVANVIEHERRPGSDPDIIVETVEKEGTFLVDAPMGTFEIDPANATWASSVSTFISVHDNKMKHASIVVVGGNVLCAGRPVMPAKGEIARFVAGRADSLVLYAVGRDEDVRAKLESLVKGRRLAIAALFVSAAVVVGVMAHYEPRLPAFHVEGGGGD